MYSSKDEVFEHYSREELVFIDNIRQIIFYSKHGCQPEYVCENEVKPGKISAWYLKKKTESVYKKWIENRPE